MAKSLGGFIRFIPEEDQETFVTLLRVRRPNIHRGMLSFITVDELRDVIRNYDMHYVNNVTQQQMAQQQAQMMAQAQAQYQAQGYGLGPGYGSYQAQVPYGGGPNYGTYSGYGTTSPFYPQPVPPLYGSVVMFAYAALVTALALQRQEEERVEEEKSSQNKVQKALVCLQPAHNSGVEGQEVGQTEERCYEYVEAV